MKVTQKNGDGRVINAVEVMKIFGSLMLFLILFSAGYKTAIFAKIKQNGFFVILLHRYSPSFGGYGRPLPSIPCGTTF